MPRRRVRLSAQFVELAEALFPPDGSPEGRPSYAQFTVGPLAAARIAFGERFDDQAKSVEEISSARILVTEVSLLFKPLVITAVLLSDDTVELVDIEEDAGFWDDASDPGPT
jgi:hypothetical protein